MLHYITLYALLQVTKSCLVTCQLKLMTPILLMLVAYMQWSFLAFGCWISGNNLQHFNCVKQVRSIKIYCWRQTHWGPKLQGMTGVVNLWTLLNGNDYGCRIIESWFQGADVNNLLLDNESNGGQHILLFRWCVQWLPRTGAILHLFPDIKLSLSTSVLSQE